MEILRTLLFFGCLVSTTIISTAIISTTKALAHVDTNENLSVVFLNPGFEDRTHSSGEFWVTVSDVMKATADDLGINLAVEYANRDHLLMERQAQAVLNAKKLPDFLILVNEKLAGESIIKMAEEKGVKSLLMLNGFQGNQKVLTGKPRERYSHWLGTVLPDNHWAGWLQAESLVETARSQRLMDADGKIHMLALSGDYVTQASVDRVKGLLDYVSANPDVVLEQIYVGLWRFDRAKGIMEAALDRYPETRVVWAANDPMALGALEAINEKNHKKKRGAKSAAFLVGGVNWDSAALKALRENQLSIAVGGHIFLGAWSLVLLYDYAHGQDPFVESEDFELIFPVFSALNNHKLTTQAALLESRAWETIDFRPYSKVLNPTLKQYQFEADF